MSIVFDDNSRFRRGFVVSAVVLVLAAIGSLLGFGINQKLQYDQQVREQAAFERLADATVWVSPIGYDSHIEVQTADGHIIPDANVGTWAMQANNLVGQDDPNQGTPGYFAVGPITGINPSTICAWLGDKLAKVTVVNDFVFFDETRTRQSVPMYNYVNGGPERFNLRYNTIGVQEDCNK